MSDKVSVSSEMKKPRTPAAQSGRRVGFARPTLVIPPPDANSLGPYSAQFTPYTAQSIGTPGNLGPTPGMYGRKASTFMFSQFNGIKDFTMNTAKSGMGIGEKCSYWIYNKFRSWSKKWLTHFFLTFVLSLYTLGGALMFTTIEGSNEDMVIQKNIRPYRYQLIRDLGNLSKYLPGNTSEGEWRGQAAILLLEYEKHVLDVNMTNAFLITNPEGKTWTMWNSIVFCATIYTSIGYGHLYPSTTTGRALTILYAIIGLPLFLIALTDFGKLFTRGIKFLWSYVRRLFYTGRCRKARKSAQMQDILKSAQMMYDIATFRRPSTSVDDDAIQDKEINISTPITVLSGGDTPTTPNLSNFEIDDEFNLPISVALFILIAYIFVGAVIYSVWEGWEFFPAFYFVFISMSTIGFGDFVPKHPICMMVSIVYLVFGLALMSMCINVVQEKLSDTFKQASQKLGASIGFEMSEGGSIRSSDNTDLAPVHAALREIRKSTDEDEASKPSSPVNDHLIVDI